jgi:translocation and assembly module TamB
VIRALKISGIVVGAMLVLLLAALSWVLWTERGGRFALQQAQGFLPPGIELGRSSGRLADHLVLEDVTVELDGLLVTVSRGWLRWAPAELLKGHLDIAELGAEGVRYQAPPRDPATPPGEPFALPERVELPVSITLARLAVNDIEARTAPDAAPVAVRRVELEGVTFADSRVEVAALALDAPGLSVRGNLTATAAGPYPLDASLNWRLMLSDYAPVVGTTTLAGSLDALELDQRIAAPYHTRLTGTAGHLVDGEPVTVDASLQVDDVRLRAVQPQLPDATVSLEAAASGPLDALQVRLDATGTDPQQRRFVAALEALVAGDAITVEQLTLRQPEREGRLSGAGRIALADEVVADLSIDWDSLGWPLAGEPTVVSPRGTLELDGPLSDYRLSLDTRVEPSGAPAVDLRVNGRGSLEQVAVSLHARAGKGTAAGQIDASWQPTVRSDVTLDVVGFDPSVLAADWPGAVDLSLSTAARLEGEDMRVTVSRLDAGGTLREQALAVAARGSYLQQGSRLRIDVETLDAALGATRLNVAGRIDERADLRWRLASDNLSELLPQARGQLSGAGQVSGELPQVRVAANLEGRDLGYTEHGLAHLDLSADLDLSGAARSQLSLIVDGATLAGTAVERIALEGSGKPAGHQLRLAVNAEPGHAEIGIGGRFEDPWSADPVWHFTLSDGVMAYRELAPWRLAEPADGQVASQSFQLGQQCWRAAEARVCLAGQQDTQGLAGQLDLTDLQFGYFADLLPEGMTASGAVSASARVSRPRDGILTAKADIDTTAGEVSLPLAEVDDSGKPAIVRLQPSQLTFDLDETHARGRVALNAEHGRLRLEAATPAAVVVGADGAGAGQPPEHQALSGSLQLDVPDLAFAAELIPTLETLQGRVSGELRLAGTVGQPTVTGSLDLLDGALSVPEPGLTLTDLGMSLRGLGRDGVALQASAASGGGRLALDGRMSPPGAAATTGHLTITGSEFQVMNNDEARLFVSPDLTVDASQHRVTITGNVHVPRADISPGRQPPSAVTVSEDQVLVSGEPDTPGAERELHAEVRLTLGDEVHFDGFGLTARLEGDVLARQEPATPTTATGELRILDGEYRAYGQGLVIDSGRIYFAGGPVTEPALDVRAVRRPKEGILVGAHVQGTLQEPSFELFSEPSMTQQEQLSYLVLGRSLDETPDGQGSALNRAVLAMGLKGGDFLAKNIGQHVGVDEIGIETGSGEAGAPSDPEEAALVVGKYLSPKLYVSYGIGLFDPESVLELQYEISRNWKLVTQSSGESTGADVLYTVERGRN